MSDHTLRFAAIGTHWTVETPTPISAALTTSLAARIETFDSTYSRFRPDSLVTAMSRKGGDYRFPADAGELLRLYRQLYETTEGALTPLIGAALDHLGYDAAYSLRPHEGPAPAVPSWDDVMVVDGCSVSTSGPVLLDFGAMGKGYLVDLVANVLGDAGVNEFVIDASGDILRRGPGREAIALEDPADGTRAIGVLDLGDGALCASSTSRRSWGAGLHHILDPSDGSPTHDVLATWVTHPSCAVADGIATALFLSPPARLQRQFDFGFLRLDADRTAEHSPAFDDVLFTSPTEAADHDGSAARNGIT